MSRTQQPEATRRYTRVRNILLAARSLPRPARTPFLDKACAGDPELRAEVDSLLGHDGTPAPAMRTGALAAAVHEALVVEAARSRAPHPERIGPYWIRGVLGEGGMGVVYAAEQTEPIRREVVLKLVRRGLDTDRVVARFEVERQTLALMDHPHIARILDAGSDESGRPYFVMERVEGEPITAFCDAHRLNLRERLDLFLEVCRGVEHAHRHGIIHRDLKPSNVLVRVQDGRPTVKIIDFGIAKLTSDTAPSSSLATQEGILVGTPEYMSPEQAGALPGGVDTRTDVYSLGVLLYELLTGHRPYRFPSALPQEIARVMLEGDPGRPSTAVTVDAALTTGAAPPHAKTTAGSVAEARRTTPSRLRQALRGDLDNIILMAMRKEPDRRYSSVGRLAEDVGRHLTGHPVSARRDSWRYRAGKFARRHAVVVTAAAAAILWLLGLAGTLVVQSARVTRERDRALAAESKMKTEAATARQVSDFVVGLFSVANPDESGGARVTAREILDRGVARIRSELGGQPAVKARLLGTMGEVYHGLGLYKDARGLLDESLEVGRRAHGERGVEVAETLDRLGTLTHDTGELDASESYYRRALDIRRAALGDSALEVGESLRHIAIAHQAKGNMDAAEPFFRQALDLDRRVLGEEHIDTAWDKNSLAWLLHQKGHYDEAESLYRAALATQRRLLGEQHPDVAGTLNNLAGVRWHKGDYADAETLWRGALQSYRALYPDGHVALARAEYNLARVLRSEEKFAEAERLYRSSLAQVRRLVGERHPAYATHVYGLGVVLTDLGRAAEAEPLLSRSLALRRELLGKDHPVVAASLEALGDLSLAEGDAGDAERFFAEARAIRDKRQPPEHPDRAIPLLGIVQARLLLGDAKRALPLAREGEALRRSALGARHPLVQEAEDLRREAEFRLAERS